MTQGFDLIVVGTGVAATIVARRCREAGWSVAVIDALPFGGTCVLRGCDPKKVLRRAAEIADAAQRFDGKGLQPEGLAIDWPALMAFKRSFTDPVPAEREKSFAKQGIARFHGRARFLDQTTLVVGEARLSARHIVIATGAEPRPLGIPGEELVTTSDRFMELPALPDRILFIGGGYISFEFAHLAARAGAKITILTVEEQFLSGFDPDLVQRLLTRSRSLGIELAGDAPVESVERGATGLRVHTGGGQAFEADLVVHGAGRVPAVEALDLDRGGLRAGKKGIEVNEYLQSPSNPAVYAAGDAAATAGPPLTPVAGLEGSVVAQNLLQGNQTTVDYSGVPSVVFTIPTLARVGLLEAEAKEQGLDVVCKLSDMSGWYTARRVGETAAAAKVLFERGTDRLLGAHLLGPESSELVNLFALALRSGLKRQDLQSFVSAYPSAGSDLGYLI